MQQSWADITAFYRQHRFDDEAFQSAFAGVAQVVALISDGPLGTMLFGWTSMHDLCIQQSDAHPQTAPYLRISPLRSGLVDFRYIDTPIAERQWQRLVAPGAACERLTAFLARLRWTA